MRRLEAVLASLALLLPCAAGAAARPAAPAPKQASLRAGERIYREGILPSGEPLRAALKGGHVVPGLTFACAGCHRRSGLGSFDEGVLTPAAAGARLFKPLPRLFKGVVQAGPPVRPAYTTESLIRAIRDGVDAGGRELGEGMPRYPLDEADARDLVAYLHALSSKFSPGVTDTSIRFATVVSEDVRPEVRKAMLAAFAANFDLNNNQVRGIGSRRYDRTRVMAEKMLESKDLAKKRLILSPWVLKGPPSTWRRQLEAFNKKEPAFVLLGGIVSGSWRPIHDFCEENQIPCLFPNTELPFVSAHAWYTVYLSKGFQQEGDAAARFLAEGAQGRPVVQVVRGTPEAEALAAGFEEAWRELGNGEPVTVRLPPGKGTDAEALRLLLGREKPFALVLWDDASALPALAALAQGDLGPERLVLSARYLGDALWTLADPVRPISYLTYPFSYTPYVPQAPMGRAAAALKPRKALTRAEVPLRDEVQRITSLTNALTQLLSTLLMDLKGNYFRDYFLDVAGMMSDQPYPLYGRISLGGDQRYASRGCSVVQLTAGENPELVEKGGRLGP
jgi:mono/diheme cytochrome c family protein